MESTIFTQMSALAHEYKAINLSQGFPGFSCSPKLVDLAHQYMLQGANQYSPMSGAPQLRRVISQKIEKYYGKGYNEDLEICITCGATEAVSVAIRSLISKGDEVIVFEPAFDLYPNIIESVGGVPVYLRLRDHDFSIPWDEVSNVITDKTKLIVINSPHNPSGAVISSDDILELEKLVAANDIYVLSDEVYEHIVFENKRHYSVIESEILREKSIVTFSLGKVFHVTGWRIGYAVAPEFLMKQFKNIHQYTTFSAATPLQLACADFLEDEANYKQLSDELERKRDFFLEQLLGTGFQKIPSYGTYFQLMVYEKGTMLGDVSLAKQLTKEARVATIPISVFYHDRYDRNILRFCFAKEDAELREAGERLRRFAV